MKNKIDQIITLLKEEFKGQLSKPHKSDPLDMLIATMLSQNTTDKTSYVAFQNLKTRFKNWEDVMEAPIKKVKDAIRVCGLVNQKAASIRNLLRQLKKKQRDLNLNFIQQMSDEEVFDELLQYNGVGVKTVSCVLAFGLGKDVFPVDTHVHRITNRLGLAHTKSPDKTFQHLNTTIPKGKKFLLHTMLIKFGRKICKANNPLCGKCILYDLCEFKEKEFYFLRGNNMDIKPKENNFIVLENV